MSLRLMLGYTGLTLVGIFLAVIFGAAVRLITQDTPSPPGAKTSAASYVVKRGDGLGAISQETGVSVERLMQLNPSLDPLALVPGQRIRLRPRTAAERVQARRRRRPRPARYVVKPGDSPSGVAEKTRVPLDRLLKLNPGIEKKPVLPGPRLKLRE